MIDLGECIGQAITDRNPTWRNIVVICNDMFYNQMMNVGIMYDKLKNNINETIVNPIDNEIYFIKDLYDKLESFMDIWEDDINLFTKDNESIIEKYGILKMIKDLKDLKR